jgi:hypothetical protein
MGDHYIPQYYLKGFVLPKNNKIWVYEKNVNRKFSVNPEKIAQENDFYSPKIEKYLANEVEAPANKVLLKIRQRQNIEELDKIIMANYIAVMMKRVPQSKLYFKEKAPEVVQSLKQDLEQELTQIALEEPNLQEEAKNCHSEVIGLLEKFANDPPKDAWLENLPPQRTPQIIEALSNMIWRFFVFDDSPAFLTCDNPVFYSKRIGIGQAESEVIFPISSHIVLWANWRRGNTPLGYVKINKQLVIKVNQCIVSNSTRYIFHAKDEYWIPQFISKNSC